MSDTETADHPGGWTGRALRVLALRLRHEVGLTRALRGPGRQESFLGLLLSADEAEAILAEASGRLRASGTAASAATLDRLERELQAELPTEPADPFCRLVRELELDEDSARLLLLAAAPALDARFGAVYGYLNDDMARRHLTPELAVRLLESRGATLATVRAILSERAPLTVYGLVQAPDQFPWIQAPLRIDEQLLDRLLGTDPGEPHWGQPLRWLDPGPAPSAPPESGIWLLAETPGRPAAALWALQAARGLGLGLLVLDVSQAPAPEAALPARLRSALREARLRGLLPVLRGFEQLPAPVLRHAVLALRAPALVLAADPASWQDARLVSDTLPHSRLTHAQAVRLLLAGHRSDSAELRAWLTRLERLDPLLLAGLLQNYREPAALRAAVRERLGRPLARLAEPLLTDYTLDDLVLPARTGGALRELVSWHATGPTVRERWHFGRVFGRGAGTTALFKGPSGTGKTMAAAAVGNALQLPVFRVDLAGLVSKYIGETEKNLEALFAAADGTDVVLFFDEADAIFGKRSEVRDAHDRYANLETAYLLQRIERHAGISILASNLHQNIDEAFLRRLDLVVDFPAPAPAARQEIWQRLHRAGAPLAPDIDFVQLAERFELTGGEIRNCSLAAAHLAAADGGVITMDTLMRAVARELAKAGRPIRRADFGEHYWRPRPDEEA